MHNHKAFFCTRNHKVIRCRMKNNAIFFGREQNGISTARAM